MTDAMHPNRKGIPRMSDDLLDDDEEVTEAESSTFRNLRKQYAQLKKEVTALRAAQSSVSVEEVAKLREELASLQHENKQQSAEAMVAKLGLTKADVRWFMFDNPEVEVSESALKLWAYDNGRLAPAKDNGVEDQVDSILKTRPASSFKPVTVGAGDDAVAAWAGGTMMTSDEFSKLNGSDKIKAIESGSYRTEQRRRQEGETHER